MSIEPEGFDEIHARGGNEHRLRSGAVQKKWQPLGVGAIEIDELLDKPS
jgi:lysine 2,3-aminomutase